MTEALAPINRAALDALVPSLADGPVGTAVRLMEAGVDPAAIDGLGNELAYELLQPHTDLSVVRQERIAKAIKLAFTFGAELTATALTTIPKEDQDDDGARNEGS